MHPSGDQRRENAEPCALFEIVRTVITREGG
jgi:hypothetical protein